ncbi:hypothetical protein EW145_g4114 [Phellinidium pouzarii]|uniref:RAVE complex protein Rav1 C-terminal domain-containing protein n=1 Tax=Phellinidium pouzarii TaxID=167371 RepID=A0A4S4L6I9_9AGAM|nr:hypothetical protein EW145_g4114 [Phellinidium pouzarii]
MLDLIHSFVGCPSSDVHILTLPDEILLVYAFVDCVVLLDARTFAFNRALAFSDVFPGIRDTNEHIKCVSIEPGMKLIAASLGSHVALWSLSGVQKDSWRVHSSLSATNGQTVTAIDCKSGLLGVGYVTGLAVYTLGLEDNMLVWTKKWFISTQPYSIVRFSPSLVHLATITTKDNTVRVYSTVSGGLLQSLRHPRPVKDFIWRFSEKSSRDDIILYTITADATLRIFLPVVDTPHFLQLHASLDLYTDVPHYIDVTTADRHSNIFWLHKDTLAESLNATLSGVVIPEDSRYRRLKEMSGEGWDLFVRVFSDNSLIIRAVANLDCRPPTLLKQFTLLQSPPSTFICFPRHLHILKTPKHPSMIFVTSPPLHTYEMDPLRFSEDGSDGMTLLSRGPDFNESDTSKILRFVRTPDGRGLAIVREHFVEAWHTHSGNTEMKCMGRWPKADLVAVLDYGKRIALYSESGEMPTLTLHGSSLGSSSVLTAIPRLISLFCLPNGRSSSLVGITTSYSIVQIQVPPLNSSQSLERTSLTISSPISLPSSKPYFLVIPVDPMAWSSTSQPSNSRQHDVLLSIADDGELAFWSLDEDSSQQSWVCTGRVQTGMAGYRLARCSSAKKSALVFSDQNSDVLTIWDSKESEFASGLEFRCNYENEAINDLDWTSTPDFQSILAVGFSQHVLLLCQQRMSYFSEEPAWGVLGRIDIGHMLTHQIADSIWLAGGTFLVGAGHHMLQYGQLGRLNDNEDKHIGLFERVAQLNGPLPDYHPQMILQCLLWGKIELVKDVIINLFHCLGGEQPVKEWKDLPIERYLDIYQGASPSKIISRPQFSVLFNDVMEAPNDDHEDSFSRSLVQHVIDELETEPLAHLTPNERAHLIVLLQTIIEVDEQRRALDSNGLRYLISMRSFYILNARVSSPSSPGSPASTGSYPLRSQHMSKQTVGRERLRYRDMVWAFHSESQEILLAASESACGGKMKWADAKALGVFLWLNSIDSMKTQMEAIARSQYMSNDARDPTRCSLFYFALGKVKLVHGLWKQAAWHKEQAMMVKFLSNDFNQPRWRTAALKNAFALLSKQRFDYAAAFFILGGGLKDAVNVCIKYLNDPQMAIAISRVVEQGDGGPVLNNILTNVMIPLAFEKGNRWLGSWAFWLLNRRDLASPLEEISKTVEISIRDIGDPNYDDPSLALLFSQLKSKTLQTAKGTNEISGKTEFNFVLQTARVFCRMGCHAMALDLVKSWSFDRPTARIRTSELQSNSDDLPGSMLGTVRRSAYGHKRQTSIMIDMDVPSDPSTRSTSPVSSSIKQTHLKIVDDMAVRKSNLGNLMKSAKQGVSVPEFDMNAFF